jgi:hypothetical protein
MNASVAPTEARLGSSDWGGSPALETKREPLDSARGKQAPALQMSGAGENTLESRIAGKLAGVEGEWLFLLS